MARKKGGVAVEKLGCFSILWMLYIRCLSGFRHDLDGNFELGFKYQNVSDMNFDGMCGYLVYF